MPSAVPPYLHPRMPLGGQPTLSSLYTVRDTGPAYLRRCLFSLAAQEGTSIGHTVRPLSIQGALSLYGCSQLTFLRLSFEEDNRIEGGICQVDFPSLRAWVGWEICSQ